MNIKGASKERVNFMIKESAGSRWLKHELKPTPAEFLMMMVKEGMEVRDGSKGWK